MANIDWVQTIIGWVPMLLLIGVWVFFMRKMSAGGKSGMSNNQYLKELLAENKRHNDQMENLLGRLTDHIDRDA